MGITLKGATPNYLYWIFEIDGRDWVAVNQSSQQPLKIQFQGRYRTWPREIPLVNTSGFNVLSSTTTKTGSLGEKQGTVEWTWAGNRYRSSWVLVAGTEVVPADPEEGTPAEYDYQLTFIGYVPYEGPVGGGVGTGVQSDATVAARKAEEANTALADSKESLEQGLAKLAKLEAQREIDVRELQEARGAVKDARSLLADAEARVGQVQSQAIDAMRQAVAAAEARVATQLANYQNQLAAAQLRAQQAETALNESRESLENAKRALAASDAQGAININALNNARNQLEMAKSMLADSEARSTQAQAAALAEMRAQIAAAEVRAQAQVEAVRQALLAQQQQPPATRPPATTPATTPPATTPPVEAPKPAGSALPLVIGIAYLLLQ